MSQMRELQPTKPVTEDPKSMPEPVARPGFRQ